MKTLMLMSILLLTVACKAEKKSVKESCTINGVSRPMSDCQAERNEQRERPSKKKASITFAIDLQTESSNSATLNVLENAEDIKPGCGIKVTSGDSSKLTKIGTSLKIVDGGSEQHVLSAVGRVNGFIGTWKKTVRNNGETFVQTIAIHSASQMTLSMECN